MKHLSKNITKFFVVLCMTAVLSGCQLIVRNNMDTKEIDPVYRFVSHALGTIDHDGENITGSNTREAFLENYHAGFRVFELDLSLTRDRQLVALHDGAEGRIGLDMKVGMINKHTFLQHKYLDRFDLLTIEDIFLLMHEYDDIVIVTDFKSDFDTSIIELDNALSLEQDLKDRFIIQVYDPEQLPIVREKNFSRIWFTLYRTTMSDNAVLRVLKNNLDVEAVVMWWDKRYSDQFADDIKKQGREVYVHTINDEVVIKSFVEKFVGVYTDYVDLEKIINTK